MTIDKQPLVSVIIPFLNGSTWLIQAIESVLNQSYSNWEMIVVDDGSEEEHSRIAKTYCLQYPGKITYTEHAAHVNKGVTISRNLGISLTKGAYIAFLDSDDLWLPKKLENQLELFTQYPEAGMICEASLFWYSWQNESQKDTVVSVGVEPGILYNPPQLVYKLYPLGKGAPPCPTGIIIKKTAFDRSGGFEESFSGDKQLYEDQAFLCKIYLREKVFISGSANNLYRKRPGSLTQSGNDMAHYYRVRRFYLDWFEFYLKRHLIKDNEIKRLVMEARTEMETAE